MPENQSFEYVVFDISNIKSWLELAQFFADQLNLSQPGGQIMPTALLLPPPPIFSDLPSALNTVA